LRKDGISVSFQCISNRETKSYDDGPGDADRPENALAKAMD
jgi:hypothetical protein